MLGYPLSTISANVKILEKAGLIITELLPAKNGSKKLCSLVYLDVYIQLRQGIVIPKNARKFEKEIPIGSYMDCKISPSCGIITEKKFVLDALDEPNNFLEANRADAMILWFRKGYVEYRIPVDYQLGLTVDSISFSMEICSEAPGFNNVFKSDISMWINGVEIGMWTSPGDFGDRRGKLNDHFWPEDSTQYGLLTQWTVSNQNTTINGNYASDITVKDLNLYAESYITMRIGVKDDAKHIGGMNLFGKEFGDYPQDIKLSIRYLDE